MNVLLTSLFIVGQLSCPGGACRPSPIEWRTRADEPNRAYLFVEGRQRGGYDGERDEWRDFNPDTGAWGDARPLFPNCAGRRGGPADFGVMRDRLAAEERFSLNGVPVKPEQARLALAGLIDDSQWLRLTIIGSAAERQVVLNDLQSHPTLAELRGRLLVQAYEPDHWAVAAAGFVRTGKPTIYLQAPDGRVLHRQDEYRGPERLAATLRRADPDYHPERDPDLDQLPVLSRLTRLPSWAWALAAILSLFLISRWRIPR
jgi:hypothetical protein